jgi:hypothetical protein
MSWKVEVKEKIVTPHYVRFEVDYVGDNQTISLVHEVSSAEAFNMVVANQLEKLNGFSQTVAEVEAKEDIAVSVLEWHQEQIRIEAERVAAAAAEAERLAKEAQQLAEQLVGDPV